ncbi:MAG TPA: hypothetical protein VF600_16695 [Abditibacteriaceae bacterium]|jgi:hypothetical protein
MRFEKRFQLFLDKLKNETRQSKRVEIFHLLRFVNSYAELPEGDFILDDKPDLGLVTSSGVLGIEHTQILEDKLKAQENLQDKVVALAKNLYDQSNGPMLWLDIVFDNHVALQRKAVEHTALALADSMLGIEQPLGAERIVNQWVYVENWQYNLRYPNTLPPPIAAVHFKYVDNPRNVLWAVSRSSVVPHLSADQIQAKVDEKADKLSEYQTKCSEVWLLIVADGGAPSSISDLPTDTAGHVYTSSFDRLFFFDNFSDTIKELRRK